MKKTISCLSLALVLLSNVAVASNGGTLEKIVTARAVSSHVDALCAAISKGDVALVKKIVNYGVDVNGTTKRGMTPLMFAAQYNNVEITNFLLESGARAYAKDSKGFTALDYAKASNAEDVVAILKKL